MTNYQKILDGTEPGKLTGGLRGLPISEYLVNHVERIVVTPELHLHLGMINTIISPRLKTILTIEEMAEWELDAGVTREDYFEGTFNGNGCSLLLENCEAVEKYAPLYYPLTYAMSINDNFWSEQRLNFVSTAYLGPMEPISIDIQIEVGGRFQSL